MKIGEKQTLTVVKKVDFGVYLTEDPHAKEADRVLLPAKQVPEGTKIGDTLTVFVYRDSEDGPIATTREPALTIGGLTTLTVTGVANVGAFLSWGLEKDLFLPFKEQTRRVAVGDRVLVTLYLDKSDRLCATMNVYNSLLSDSTYRKDEEVTGTVYQISERFGAFVAVDDLYSALIPHKALFGANIAVGDRITARISKVMDDGRLELAVRQKSYLQQETDGETLIKLMKQQGGALPFTEKASPERIFEETGMSKAQFKRAIGGLLKSGKIEFAEDSIRLV